MSVPVLELHLGNRCVGWITGHLLEVFVYLVNVIWMQPVLQIVPNNFFGFESDYSIHSVVDVEAFAVFINQGYDIPGLPEDFSKS